MLSNPNPNLQQRQHRRQNSTPTAFEAAKVPLLHQFQRPSSHRRGMSLDQRPQQRRQIYPQETVSNTNTGFQPIQQQHILREAQQQRLARPGHRTPQHSEYGEEESYLISPLGTPARSRSSFDTGYSSFGDSSPIPSSYDFYTGPINQIIKVNSTNTVGLGGSNDLSFNDNSTLSPSAYLQNFSFDDAPDQQSTYGYRTTRRRPISGGIANRVTKFENIGEAGSISRPVTPPNQYASGYFPPTPVETPYNNRFKTENTPHNTPRQLLEPGDTSMEETVKPIRRRSALCNVDIFEEMRRESEEGRGMLSPPNTAPLPASSIFDSSPMPMSNIAHKNVDQLKSDPGYESSNYSPTSTTYSPRHISRHSSPRFPQVSLFRDPFENKPTFDISHENPYLQRESRGLGIDQNISPSHGPSMERSDSISSINLEESITETGITIDDIATFIEGPGPDNKWLCLYPDCKKRFGRKENIKSHVQTHLGDRQYQCPHCQKCFVRQHDLKRHAKIHSGVKPYPCLCGNSFARHDALTRHRQRGMCIGAFEGVVKKVVKRGRPRKPRPDVDERQEKSSRTRSKNKTMSSASSASGYSESNPGNSPPPATFDGFDRASFGGSQNRLENVRYSQAAIDCIAPQEIQSTRPTSALSTHSYHSNHRHSTVSLSDHLPSNHGSRANTPPSLSQSSSSPTPGAHYFDLEAASEESEHGDIDTNSKPVVRFSDLGEDDDIFLQDYSSNLNQDPDIMMMNKFADAFGASGNTNEMFGTLESDVFFGSP